MRKNDGKGKSAFRMAGRILMLGLLVVFGVSCAGDKAYEQLLSLESHMEQDRQAVADSLRSMDLSELGIRESALHTYLTMCCQPSADSLPVSERRFEEALRYLEENGDSLRLSRLYYEAASLFHRRFYLIRAQDCYEKGLSFLNSQSDPHLAFDLNVGLGRIYHFNRMYAAENRALDSASEIADTTGDSLLSATVSLLVTLRYKERKMYEEAGKSIEKARNYIGGVPSDMKARILIESGVLSLYRQHPDSALYYLEKAVHMDEQKRPVYRMLCDGLRCYLEENDSARIYFDRMMPYLNLEEKVTAYRYVAELLSRRGEKTDAQLFLEKHVTARDSLDRGRKDELVDKLQAVREYRRQRARIESVEKQLAGTELFIYRMLIVSFVVSMGFIGYYFRTRFHKIKLKRQLMETEHERIRLDLERRESELRYMKEREEKEKLEMARLNQKLDYYKRLNEITIPILMQDQSRSGSLHFKESDWAMVRNNTNACFENFTERLKQQYPQLNEEEINFCCLVKMELSIALLSEIYHIAKGSISRKKMRLKEKMSVENQSFDDFIASF